MTPTPKTETVDQILVDQAKEILAVCATPEGLRGLVDLWRDGSGTMDKHNRYVGSCLSVLVDTFADDIAAGCARSVANQRQLDARWRRRQNAKQRVRVLAGGRSERSPQAPHPTTHPHLHLQPLV